MQAKKRIRWVLLLVSISLLPVSASVIYPVPRQLEITDDQYFSLDSVYVGCPDAEAASWVRKHLKEWYGKSSPVVCVLPTGKGAQMGKEEYALRTEPRRTTLQASTLQGIRYAAYSLRQIAIPERGTKRVEGWIVPKADVQDKPELSFRGIHICWFHESQPWQIERMIRLAAYYKLNYAVIESWGTFRSKTAPWYGWPDGTMKHKEIKRLKAIADDLGITLIPQLNVFGHATCSRSISGKHATMDLSPEYQNLFEPVEGWNWCLTNPATRQLLCSLIDEMHEAFGNPPYFHLGCDEAQEPSCPTCKARPYSEIVIDHIKAMNEEVRKRGARSMVWHDMFLQQTDERWNGFYHNGSPETAAALLKFPKDIIICDWFYGDACGAYPTMDYFKGLGFSVLACPWDNVGGIRAQTEYAQTHGIDGVLGTTWHHYFGQSMVDIYVWLANSVWHRSPNKDLNLPNNGSHFRTHLRQIGWDMKLKDPKKTGILVNEVPLEPTPIPFQ